MNYLAYFGIGIFLGVVAGYVVRQTIASKQIGSAEENAKKILVAAKNEAKEALIEAKDKAVNILAEVKDQEKRRNEQILRLEERLEKREELLDNKLDTLEKSGRELQLKAERIKEIQKEIEELKEKRIQELQRVSNLTEGAAKKLFFEEIEEKYKEELSRKISQLEVENKEELEKKACNLMVLAMQKYGATQVCETATTIVNLPSDEVKGRIIGREGRNIRTLENLTGVEIIVDDTPEAIVISGFDPVRRQIAKLALDKLIADGRIHPARIEEMIELAKKEINSKIKEAGEAAVYDVGIAGLDPKLVHLLGRLRFRTSYGQNVLLHSLEVAHLAGALAAELKLNVALAKKAGLLHDIGKAIDREIEGTHVEIGRALLEKFNISTDVIKAMQSHHEDYPYESTEAILVQVADAISASRPGARKDTLENYLKRITELEGVATSFEEVDRAYAIQAGREIRVFVIPEKTDDISAVKLARNISQKIENDLEYPGEIKVNVIRELRAVDFAR